MLKGTLVRQSLKIRKILSLVNDWSPALGIAVVCLTLIGGGCASREPTGRGLEWESKQLGAPDLPFVEFQAHEVHLDSTSVELWIGVRPESLTFLRLTNRFEAVVELEFRGFSREGRKPLLEEFWTESIGVETYAETQATGHHALSRRLDLPAGEYQVELTVRDRTTGKEITRRRSLSIGSIDEGSPYTSEIQVLQGETMESSQPVLGPYAVTSKGRLFGVFHVLGGREDTSFASEISVVLVGWDSTMAAPPFSFNPVRGSLAHTGLDLETADTVQIQHLESTTSRVTFELIVDRPGVYLIAVQNMISLPDGGWEEIRVQRPMVLMPPGFPRPSSLEGLIQPVTYLLRDDEMETISSLDLQADRRDWLEQFWRKTGGNEHESEDILEHYYSRVEEANEYFSSFKPGWQTDRGMVYIIFGQPMKVRQRLNVELWSYSHTDEDVLRTFEFKRVPLQGGLDLFDHFVLERQPYYDNPWMIAVDRWRYGIGY